MGSDRAERHVVVPVELLERAKYILANNAADGDELAAKIFTALTALSAAPPVQMEAVAWRVGVPNNEYATLHEDVAEIARKHGYEVTPLYASPVPSSERDEPSREVMLNGRQVTISGLALEVLTTMEKSAAADTRAAFERGYSGARKADADRIAMIIQDDLRIERGSLENVSFVAVKIAESIERTSSDRDDIIEMCAAKLDAESVKMKERCCDPDETVSRAILIGKAQHYSDAASSIRSLKSQPAQEGK